MWEDGERSASTSVMSNIKSGDTSSGLHNASTVLCGTERSTLRKTDIFTLTSCCASSLMQVQQSRQGVL